MDLKPKPPLERANSLRKKTSLIGGSGDRSEAISAAYHARMAYVREVEDDLERKGISTPPMKTKTAPPPRQASAGHMPALQQSGSLRTAPGGPHASQSVPRPRGMQQQESSPTVATTTHQHPVRPGKAEHRRGDEVRGPPAVPVLRLRVRCVRLGLVWVDDGGGGRGSYRS